MSTIVSAAESVDRQVRQVWQLLDYVAVDYGGAVANGEVVNAAEFQEMSEFTATIGKQMKELPARDGQQQLLAESEALQAAVARHDSSDAIARLAHGLADRLLATYPLPATLNTVPDRARGAALYSEQCAGCHGATGHGDGPVASGLDPRPVAFTDAGRARERSLLSLYEAISQGVAGTSMPSFASLSEQDRWALAFYVGTFAYPAAAKEQGARLWKNDDALRHRIAGLDALGRLSESKLAEDVGPGRANALIAYLRSTPSALVEHGGLALTRSRLDESVRAYAAGDRESAGRLALSAYLDGFEPVEPQLSARDPALLARVEAAMSEYRARIAAGAPVQEVTAQASAIGDLLDQAAIAIDGGKTDAVAAFLASFTILVREGLEALLMVVAIVAFLRKAERRDVMGYIHGGWISALLAGALTWVVAEYFVSVSGAGRELTEGYSSLFAALVLLSVGLWMHQKSLAGRWQRYINERLAKILNGRSAWLLAALAFIMVYREVFETILFYAALTTASNARAVLAGVAVGSGALALIAVALLRFSARLPIGKFFSISSIFIAILAVVLAGKGAAALQEAGVISIRTLHVPSLTLLGVFPTVQTLALQALVALAAIAGFAYNAGSARRK